MNLTIEQLESRELMTWVHLTPVMHRQAEIRKLERLELRLELDVKAIQFVLSLIKR